ncbi:putative Alpha-(1-_3)-arabinofuranosyltransferase [Streptomyces afghaniensis 772]|uniref:Putative Alpha-(1->3)-arabinofuranosyltransferase n=1 Tax=Streptomyces afghaniensis 772 TaxID=1283301 RepID=S4MSC8_9ACTN|nr:putative Alpha-(1->3)-arabinofuranosyltransferase [Streptomyces afghaniensis 772]
MSYMTTTVQAPPPAAVPTTATAAGPPEGPRSRRWLLGFWAVVFVLFLAVQPGRQTFDTKLGVTVDPGQFLADLGQLWHDRAGFGGIQDQYVGYLWPMLPFYWLCDLVQLPVWLAERLWLSIVVSVAFWGALRLAERLRVGSGASRLLAAAAYALWPVFTTVIGSTSAAALPGAFLPWVLLPLTNERYAARVAALRSALLVPFMGGVNASATLASLLPVGLYLLSRPPGPRQRKLIAWWAPAVLVVTAWWWVPLLLLGVYGENFLPYIETSQTTTDTMSATEALRGAGNWVAYLHFGEAWLPAGWAVASSVVVIVCSALAAGLGLAGLARRDMPERRWLVLTVLVAALVLLAGYGGAFGAPFHGVVQGWLDGWLSPFRNIYKFQTGLALAFVLGLAHLVGVAAEPRGARPVRGRRFAPLVAAVLILPGLLWPYLNGSILNPGSFQKLPAYWQATADWLEKYSPDSRALVVPATAHGVYTWGSPIDQPLDVLAESRWAQRDYVPFGTPGNRRAMDAVEQALTSGAEVPGLADYLSRAGLYYVVVRNDLDPDQIGYVPTATVKRTLEQSGYERVTGLGPVMTGGRIAQDAPLQVEGLYPRQRAVEIYRPTGQEVVRPGQAGLMPVSDTAVVSGGPEALLPLASRLRGRATVLTGDNHPGLGTPAVQVTGDGMRRADTRFGVVNAGTSYTYTRDERNAPDAQQDPGEKPRQILPAEGTDHQTVAELRGARSVTASSYGNWLFHLPQYDPVNAFDGNPDTAWAEGAPDTPDGQWLRIGFTGSYDMPSSFKVTPLPQESVRAAATKVRVETEKGERTSFLRPNGTAQRVRAPEGGTRWMKLTIVDSVERRAGLTGAGFSEIDLPDVQVTRLLRLPVDAADATADADGRLPAPDLRPDRPLRDRHRGRPAPPLHDTGRRDVRGGGERGAGAGRGTRPAAVRGGARAAVPDRRHRRLHGGPRRGPRGTQPHRRRPDDGVDRGRPSDDPPELGGQAAGRRTGPGARGRSVHPRLPGAHQLPGRRDDRGRRRERLGPLPADHHGPARHHDHRDRPADPAQPGRRRGSAAARGPDGGIHPLPRPVPHPAAGRHPEVLAAVRQGARRGAGRRAVPDEREGHRARPGGTAARRGDTLPTGQEGRRGGARLGRPPAGGRRRRPARADGRHPDPRDGPGGRRGRA